MKKVRVKRKEVKASNPIVIYSFESFDDIVSFCKYASKNILNQKLFLDKNTLLFEYQDRYYMCFKNLNCNASQIKKFCSIISEFGTYIEYSSLFARKLNEYGNIIIGKNVIGTFSKKF